MRTNLGRLGAAVMFAAMVAALGSSINPEGRGVGLVQPVTVQASEVQLLICDLNWNCDVQDPPNNYTLETLCGLVLNESMIEVLDGGSGVSCGTWYGDHWGDELTIEILD